MRKSLGNKRNELADKQIAEFVRIYGNFAESGIRVFDNDDFGYRKITVERPLRLSFSATPEHLAAFEASRPFEGIATSRKSGKEGKKEVDRGQAVQAELLAALRTLPADRCGGTAGNSPPHSISCSKAELSAPVRKAILAGVQ